MIRKNLEDVAAVLRREAPLVVAMQRSRRPCAWSGNFDHVQYVAHKGELPIRCVVNMSNISAIPMERLCFRACL